MATSLDITEACKRYLNSMGIPFKSLNTGNVKLKLDSTHNIWRNDTERNLSSTGPTRVLELSNNSMESGEGNFSITKVGKPVLEYRLTSGAVKGLTNRVKFPDPTGGRIGPFILLPVDQMEKNGQIRDHTKLELNTTVPLSGQTTAYAKLSNSTDTYNGSFKCQGTLSGKVAVERADKDSIYEVNISKLVTERFLITDKVQLEGRISVTFQNGHQIAVQ